MRTRGADHDLYRCIVHREPWGGDKQRGRSRAAIVWRKVNERDGGYARDATLDITAWLHLPGLQQYEATFRDNAINAEMLTELIEVGLEKLGVRLGHGKNMVKAINELRVFESDSGGAFFLNSALSG